MFQLMFAIITVALVSGAVADRLKFGAWLVFAGLWATFVYFPVAHWVFAFDGFTGETGGWIANKLKAIDFAGGTAVHINSGAAGLALCLVLGRAQGLADHADAAAQPAVRDARCRSAVVRLVRVQRRFGAVARAVSPASTFVTTTVATGNRHAGLAARREDPRRARPPRWVRHRASSPASSRSRRPVRRSTSSVRSSSDSSAGRSVRWPSG